MMIPPLPHNTTTLVLRRVFTASRQRVFRAWIEPEALQSWFRPRGMSVIVSKLDARVGGSFRFDVEDGTATTGTYLQVDPPERLVFIWSGGVMGDKETIVTLDFLDLVQYPQSGPQNAESSVRLPGSLQPQGVYPTNPKMSSGFAPGPATEVVLTHERLNTPELRAMFEGGWLLLFDVLAEILSDDVLFR